MAGEGHVAVASAVLSGRARLNIFTYLGILILMLAFGSPAGGLIDIPISFLLKNKLHLQAHEVAGFRLVAAIPLYLAFAFGFLRDIWNPFGMRDRGFMLLFGSISGLLYVGFAFTPISYLTLLLAVIVPAAPVLLVSSAPNGLNARRGQQQAVNRPITAAGDAVLLIPPFSALVAGGAPRS